MAGEGEQIEQALAGVAMQAIAAIEHRHPLAAGLQASGQAGGHAGTAVAHHQQVGPHGHVGAGGVEQALALAQGARRRRKTLDIGREALSRQLKAAAGAGAGLKEQGGHQAPLQGRQLASSRHG